MATQSFQRILELLEAHDVEYIVVGGVAAVLRGAPVTTFDIDTLVRIDQANAGGHLLLMTDSGPLDVLGHLLVLAGIETLNQAQRKLCALAVGEPHGDPAAPAR